MDILFILLVLLTIVTLVGHGVWVAIAAVIRLMLNDRDGNKKNDGVTRLFEPVNGQLNDLAATERQLVLFYRDGKINEETYELLMARIRAERDHLLGRQTTPPPKPRPAPAPGPSPIITPPSVVTTADEEIVIKPVPTFIAPEEPARVPVAPVVAPPRVQPPPPPPQPPPPRARRPFSEVLNSFMEESNIRWGEIIGGLLIIGCSTALVVSLWAQISQIPVLKFLIFTTVTAILFGIGLYTEHRWKLPTTSRGILTIATLLVPLNFLAIAAVSAGNTSGALVIGSELLAPAIFLCLVYFAGRVITPGCAHVLSAGVLGSSIGQLLVRHFAEVDTSPTLLILLGAFPVCCYVATVGLALRIVLADSEIDETETTTVFTVLGTMSFAALLPFGLLLYKSGPVAMSMMYLAPLVTLWGLPMLATGTILWRRISNKELVASRTTGTALGILGVMIVLAGMILAWPNPASIVPAALLNFAVFTVLALTLELPVAHLIAAICFALAYLVTGHVLVGNITWQNLRVMSLLKVSFSTGSGEALIGTFALFLGVSEWLSRRKREADSHYYLVSACLVAVVSLMLVIVFGAPLVQYALLWVVLGIYSLGAFWIAWRHKLTAFAWIGSALLLFSMAHNFAYAAEFSFPFQTALFAHATICGLAAIVCLRYERGKILSAPLNNSALISIVFGVIALFQANTWEVTWLQAQRVFWIAGILLLLLWLNRRRVLLNAFQIALVCALALTVKASLQGFEWYSYLPHAFLHPAALQIQGTVIALFCLAWIAMRFVVKSALAKRPDESWLKDAWRLLDSFSVDRLIVWLLPGAFLLLAFYGAMSGLFQELAALGKSYYGFNIAEFPHQEALGVGSWIVLGLLLLIMLANFWERRRRIYLLGALLVLSAVVPLLAGQFENQGATATAFRWLTAMFLLAGSVVLWYRNPISKRLATFGWPEFNSDAFITEARTLLLSLTFAPLLLFTLIPALAAILYQPVQIPFGGFFSLLDESILFGFPLVVAAFVMIGYALRERLPRFAFYAGALLNATVTLAFLLTVVAAHGPMNRVVLVRLAQLNILTFAVYSLPWLSTRARWLAGLDQSSERLAHLLLKLQLALALSVSIVLFLPVMASLILLPDRVGIGAIAAGSFLGWLAFFAVVANATWLAASRVIRLPGFAFGALLFALSCLIGFSASSINGWVGLYTLAICTTVSAWLLLRSHPRSSALIGGLAVFLNLRTLADADISHWWSVGPLLALTALAATLNWRTLQRRYIFAAGILFNLTVSLWWFFVLKELPPDGRFLLTNLIAVSLAGMLWVWLELRSRRLSQTTITYGPGFSFHNFAAIASLSVLTLFVVLSGFAEPAQSPLVTEPLLTWLAFVSFVMFMTACLWDRYARYAVGGLYILGLIACAIALQQLELSPMRFAWSATIVLAVYTVLTTLLWHWRSRLIDFALQFGVPQRIDPETTELAWFAAYSVLAVAATGVLAYWINVSFLDFGLRVSVAVALAAQCVALTLLAEGDHEKNWRRAAIVTFTVGAILIGWSWLTPGIDATWLNRSVILMVETFGLTALYGLWLAKANARWPSWTSAARACVPWLLGAGSLALFFCLATEVSYQLKFGAVLVNPFSLVAVGVTLVAAVVICVLFALSPNHDPLSLSERGRMRYVYVAEVMLALLFLHVRLTMPWLFTGFIERYWPLVVMLIAYFGVTTSEALRRRKLLVLARPLERTGAFLPLLPVLGFWLASSDVDFSVLLFIVGGLYGLLSILRRSFWFGLLAAVAGNAGLWYIWQRTTDFQFLQHPQLWLIPIALSVLIAAYLNEERMTEDQMAGIRYLSLVTIYVSSTADIFINGVANSPWLPLILGSFSLAGVFAGILFRIRGLLLLGAIFLLLSIVTMIWYASVNFGWTWLWYVAGIVTGATIIFMFALFEKKRSEVLRVVEGLKEWER